MKEFKLDSLEAIDSVAKEFVLQVINKRDERNVFAFYGAMGAGKTTFISAICRAMGVEDMVNSPTFTIVNEYQTAKGDPLYHFDFYRIESLSEAFDIGIEEYFDSGELCFIEWPEKIERLLPESYIQVKIESLADNSRTIEVNTI